MNPGAVVLSRTGPAVAADFSNATGAPIVGDTQTGQLYWYANNAPFPIQGFYNAMAFGADNTGASDSSPAIARAILSIPTSAGGSLPTLLPAVTAQGGYALYFPPGVYRIDSTIVIGARRVMFLGNGMIGSNGTILWCQNPNIDIIDYYTGNLDTFSMYGIELFGAGKGTGTGNGVRLGNAAQTCFDSQFQNCWMTAIPNAGIYADYCADMSFQNNGLENSTYGIYFANLGIASGDINKVTGSTFYGLTYGIYSSGGEDLHISSNQISFCGTNPGSTGDDISGGIVINKNGAPTTRGTHIGVNTFRANVNDIILNGHGGVNTSNTGVNDTIIVNNYSDRAYRRFLLCTDANQTRVLANSINTPNQETGGTFDAVEIAGTSDGTFLDGNSVSLQRTDAFRPPYGLTLRSTTTNTKLGNNYWDGKTGTVNVEVGATFRGLNNYLFHTLPTAAAGLPTGALWNNAGVVNVA